jgi:hypothetical protein
LKEKLAVSIKDVEQRKAIIQQLHMELKRREDLEQELTNKIKTLNKKIEDYLGEEQSYDVYKIGGLFSTIAKVTFCKSNDGDYLFKIECSGKKSSILVTDIIITKDQLKSDRFIVEYNGPKGLVKEIFQSSNVDKVLRSHADLLKLAEAGKKQGVKSVKAKESEIIDSLNVFFE